MGIEDQIEELENKVEDLEETFRKTYDLFVALFQLFSSYGESGNQHIDYLQMMLRGFTKDHKEDLNSLLP